jgi:hypothetical protein
MLLGRGVGELELRPEAMRDLLVVEDLALFGHALTAVRTSACLIKHYLIRALVNSQDSRPIARVREFL